MRPERAVASSVRAPFLLFRATSLKKNGGLKTATTYIYWQHLPEADELCVRSNLSTMVGQAFLPVTLLRHVIEELEKVCSPATGG
jgi:hypothetical protein